MRSDLEIDAIYQIAIWAGRNVGLPPWETPRSLSRVIDYWVVFLLNEPDLTWDIELMPDGKIRDIKLSGVSGPLLHWHLR
jgi:hypothetical protein